MAVINYNRVLRLPSVSSKFDRDIKYIIGYYIGSAFHVCAWVDSFELAVVKRDNLQLSDDENQYFIYECRTELFLLS